MTPTPEQSAILSADPQANLMIVARAGCGKSATLKLLDAALPSAPRLYLVFNKTMKLEAERSGEFRSTTIIKTLNSLGHTIWATAASRRLALSKDKIRDIFRAIADDTDRGQKSELWANYDIVTSGVNLARALGYIPSSHPRADKSLCSASALYRLLDERPSPLAKSLIDRILLESIRQAYLGTIDFPDQTYMPALFGGVYPRFPTVLIDEYQDLSPVNHAMVAKLCRSSRQIGVGDDAQAIYGFRGAADHSMADAIRQFEMVTYPLTLSFRCPSAIVANVHWRVPEFRAARDGGVVNSTPSMEIADDATILCRNNAPLVRLAMSMVAAGRSVDVAGADISSRVVRLLQKLGDESMSQGAVLSAIDDWQAAREVNGSTSAADTADCMRVFARQGKTLSQAIGYAQHLFAQSGTIRFLTGHKSKGLEWTNVYHLDPDILTSHGQDPNLRYVIDTRTSDRLTYIRSHQ